MPKPETLTGAICETGSHLSYLLKERALAVITHSGSSVKVLSKYRPQSPIYAATFNSTVYHKMAFFHNVHPILLDKNTLNTKNDHTSCSIEQFENSLEKKKLVKKTDTLICLTGDISPKGWKVNTIKVKKIN